LVIKALDPDWIRIRIRIGVQPQPLDPDPEKMNTDPKHWDTVLWIRIRIILGSWIRIRIEVESRTASK
jgi:hypothetical protein